MVLHGPSRITGAAVLFDARETALRDDGKSLRCTFCCLKDPSYNRVYYNRLFTLKTGAGNGIRYFAGGFSQERQNIRWRK